jgi:hypothetical protein
MFTKLAPLVHMGCQLLAVALLATVFVWRRLFRELPFFFLYLISALSITGLRYAAMYAGPRTYFYTYWISDLAGSLVVLLAIYEVFLRRLFRGFQKIHFYRNLFPVAAGICLLLTVLSAAQANDRNAAFQMASRAFDFMRTAILVFFIGLMALMGREWTRYDLGIALGFGFQAAAALANAAVRARMHYRPTFMDTVQGVAYDVSCLVWLATFVRPEHPPLMYPSEHFDPEMLRQARTWQATLRNWLTRGNTEH